MSDPVADRETLMIPLRRAGRVMGLRVVMRELAQRHPKVSAYAWFLLWRKLYAKAMQ